LFEGPQEANLFASVQNCTTRVFPIL